MSEAIKENDEYHVHEWNELMERFSCEAPDGVSHGDRQPGQPQVDATPTLSSGLRS
jgi:hypothetical protein